MHFELTLLLNRACNLACDYCYDRVRTSHVMSPETFQKALKWALSRVSPGETLGVQYFGGEPLLNFHELVPMHAEACRMASEKRVDLAAGIVTNGTLLDREVWSWAQGQNIDVTISLDGGSRTHDLHRRYADGTGSFARIREALAGSMIDRDRLSFAAVLSPDTVDSLHEGVSEFIDQGFTRFSFSPDYRASWDDAARDRAERGIKALGDLCLQSLQRDIPVFFSFVEEKIRRLLPGDGQPVSICTFGRAEAAIDPEGSVYPCERIIGAGEEFRLGHIDELLSTNGSVASLGNRIAAWTSTPVALPGCGTCDESGACTRFCRCINHLRTGSIFAADDLVCFFERQFIRASKRIASMFLAPHGSGNVQSCHTPQASEVNR